LSILTEITLRNLKVPERGQILHADGSLAGFGVRVSQGGTKTFTLIFGMPRRRVISLSAARQRAREILAEYTLGKNRPKTIGYNEAVSLFLSERAQRIRPNTLRGYAGILKNHFPFQNRHLSDIGVEDIKRRIDKLSDSPVQRRYALTVVKMLFRWAVRNRFVDYSPCDALTAASCPPRERVLTEAELRTVFSVARVGDDNFARIVTLLILLGQRRTETASIRWEWIDTTKRTITLPVSITKNKRSHTFPYGDMVATLLEKIPHDTEYVFPAGREHVRGKPTGAFNGWQKCKATFDKKCQIAPWTLHDLRRTFATNLAALGVAPHVVERLLNHSSGTISGVAAIYNRYSYMNEMRDAMKVWERHLIAMLRRLKRAA